MIMVEKIIGNAKDPQWINKLNGYAVDHLHLEQWEAPKNRIRKKSHQGFEIAISLPRDQQLKNNDILYIDETNRVVVITEIRLKDVMVIRLDQLNNKDDWQKLIFQLGHALGNQHWPAIFKDNIVYVPFYVDRKIMSSVIRTHAFEGISFEFTSGDEVAPLLAPSEMRLL
ncbi:MAG: urease accessory protein UreE, partial [Plesiomonas sp.]